MGSKRNYSMLRFPLSEVVIHNSGGRPASTQRERRYPDTGSPWPVPLTVVSERGQGGGLPTRALSPVRQGLRPRSFYCANAWPVLVTARQVQPVSVSDICDIFMKCT